MPIDVCVSLSLSRCLAAFSGGGFFSGVGFKSESVGSASEREREKEGKRETKKETKRQRDKETKKLDRMNATENTTEVIFD